MDDDTVRQCYVEGCEAFASERAPGVSFCDDHWDALCDAYARQRAHAPAHPAASAHALPARGPQPVG